MVKGCQHGLSALFKYESNLAWKFAEDRLDFTCMPHECQLCYRNLREDKYGREYQKLENGEIVRDEKGIPVWTDTYSVGFRFKRSITVVEKGIEKVKDAWVDGGVWVCEKGQSEANSCTFAVCAECHLECVTVKRHSKDEWRKIHEWRRDAKKQA